ncbi:MAG TPA: pentapeptide repeat-containing protein [Ktedonobacterales bacterium]|jgi:uncharacterized protein YjbI with pentapeptide repeats
MADQEQVQRLREGAETWNAWRLNNTSVRIDLSYMNLPEADPNQANLQEARLNDASLLNVNLAYAQLHQASLFFAHLQGANLYSADLSEADLSHADLRGVNLARERLDGATLRGTHLTGADLSGADLTGADLVKADLSGANLSDAPYSRPYAIREDPIWGGTGWGNLVGAVIIGADLSEADLRGANLSAANLRRANLSSANLSGARLTAADLAGANLSNANLSDANFNAAIMNGCRIYGISAWNVQLDEAQQVDLLISRYKEPDITVDNLEVAQFLYLMLHSEKIRGVLETITSKVVLILGRFSDERKPELDALRVALRGHPNHYVPVLFDFDLPTGKHILETVALLARLARFVIADITDPSMVRAELVLIAPTLPSVPIQPLQMKSATPMAEFPFLEEYPGCCRSIAIRIFRTCLRRLTT